MGEKQNDREVIDRQTQRLIQSGTPPAKAHQTAKESLRRVDEKLRREGKR